MKVSVKLYATLDRYLPDGAKENLAEIDLPSDATIAGIISKLGLPQQYCHLVLNNGIYVTPDDRSSMALNEGDVIAIWPPVAGG